MNTIAAIIFLISFLAPLWVVILNFIARSDFLKKLLKILAEGWLFTLLFSALSGVPIAFGNMPIEERMKLLLVFVIVAYALHLIDGKRK